MNKDLNIANDLPYNPYRESLYTWKELMHGYSPEKDDSLDLKIYKHFSTSKFTASLEESLSQRLHDHYIDTHLKELLGLQSNGMVRRKAIAIMGGHSILRTDKFYYKTALLAKNLTENGYFIMSGGGPGIMEAANLGAYFAGKTKDELKDAIEIMKKAPLYKDDNFIKLALDVLKKYPQGKESLAIPTWFYGHEPSNLFASHIAKYFANSLREDVLISTAMYGIIYAPGSAGTVQEIFTDAAQNYYGSLNFISPMVFLGIKHYKEKTKIYDLVESLSTGKKYHNMLQVSDKVNDIVKFIKKNPPIKERA